MKLGEKILSYRKKLGLSQEELGAKVGVSRQTVSKWEIGQTIPELEKMILLAKEFATTIDDLVKDENQVLEEQDIRQESIKSKFLIKLCNKKVVKSLIVIFSVILIFFIVKVSYRIVLLNGFEKQIREFIPGYYLDRDPVEENYRLEVTTFNIERGISGVADEMTAFYVKSNKYVKKTMINGELYNPIKIEHLDYDTGNYYDIDTVNKSYIKEMYKDLGFKKTLELTAQNEYLINDILENFKIEGWKNKIKFALDFDKKIRIWDGYRYSINIMNDTNITRSVGVDFKNISYTITTLNENNASCHTTINYNLDKDVVVAESLTELPDLIDYTEIQN